MKLEYKTVIRDASLWDGSYVETVYSCQCCASIWKNHYSMEDTLFGKMVITKDWSTVETHKEFCVVPEILRLIQEGTLAKR